MRRPSGSSIGSPGSPRSGAAPGSGPVLRPAGSPIVLVCARSAAIAEATRAVLLVVAGWSRSAAAAGGGGGGGVRLVAEDRRGDAQPRGAGAVAGVVAAVGDLGGD